MNRTRSILLCITAATACLLLALGVDRFAEAQGEADAQAELDAGVATAPVDPVPAVVEPQTPAQPPPVPLPDPVADPGGYVEVLEDLWRSGAGVVAVLAGFLGLAVYLRRQKGYFREGWQALIFAGAATGVTTLVTMAASGQTPNAKMCVAVVFGAVLAALKGYGDAPGGAS